MFFLCGKKYLLSSGRLDQSLYPNIPDPRCFNLQYFPNCIGLKPPLNAQKKHAIPLLIPLLAAGILAGMGAGFGGLGTSLIIYQKLSLELAVDIEQIADSMATLQSQLNALAAVTLQNRELYIS